MRAAIRSFPDWLSPEQLGSQIKNFVCLFGVNGAGGSYGFGMLSEAAAVVLAISKHEADPISQHCEHGWETGSAKHNAGARQAAASELGPQTLWLSRAKKACQLTTRLRTGSEVEGLQTSAGYERLSQKFKCHDHNRCARSASKFKSNRARYLRRRSALLDVPRLVRETAKIAVGAGDELEIAPHFLIGSDREESFFLDGPQEHCLLIGARFVVNVSPSAKLSPLHLPERGEITRRLATAWVAALPGEIARRELGKVEERLGWSGDQLQIRQLPREWGPGNVLMLEIESEYVTEVFTAFGEKRVTAEAVSDGAISDAREYLAAGVPVGQHLADQLLLPMAMAGGGSFTTMTPTLHTRTNAEVIARFLPMRTRIESHAGSQYRIELISH